MEHCLPPWAQKPPAQVDDILAEELPQYEFAANYGGEEPQRSSFILIGYTPETGAVPGNYAEYLPLDASFSKDLLQDVPTRLMLQCTWPTTPHPGRCGYGAGPG